MNKYVHWPHGGLSKSHDLKDGLASVTSIVPRSDGRDALSFLVEEDPSVIIAALDKAHREQVQKEIETLQCI